MERNKLSAIAFIAIILGAIGAGVGVYAVGVTLTGGADGDNGDDGDDGVAGRDGKDGTIIGQVIQMISNSTSDAADWNPGPTSYRTFLTVKFNASADSNLFCVATLGTFRVYDPGAPSAADLRFWLDESIELIKITKHRLAGNSEFDIITLQNIYEGISEGAHNITLQIRLHPSYNGRIYINWDNAISVLTIMEIDK